MSKLGSKNKPARVRVQKEERGVKLVTLCNVKRMQVIVGIEPDKQENIDDIKKFRRKRKGIYQLRYSFFTKPSMIIK